MPLGARIFKRGFVDETEADHEDVRVVITDRSDPSEVVLARSVKDFQLDVVTLVLRLSLVSVNHGRRQSLWKLVLAISYEKRRLADTAVADDYDFDLVVLCISPEHWQGVLHVVRRTKENLVRTVRVVGGRYRLVGADASTLVASSISSSADKRAALLGCERP